MLDSQKNSNRYDKYKDSGIKWIGAIPDSWCIRKLNSLLNAIGSGTTPKGNDNYYDGDIYWLNTGDLNDSYISTINKTVTEIALQECSTLKIFPKDSVVIAMYGATIGKLGILMFPATTNQACCVMSCSEQLNNKYLFYLLFAAREFIINLSYGAGQPNISQETIKSFRLSFPSIKEQEAIAGYLDRKCGAIDETIEKQKSVIEKLKEYKQSIITQAVTKGLDKSAQMKDSGIEWIGQIPQHWEVRKLKTIGDYRNGLTYSPEDICEENNGTLVLRSSNIKNGKISFNDNVYVSSNIPEILKVKKGDILICSRNGSKDLIGKNALITEDINASFGAFMMIFRCKCPQYLYNVLNSHIFSYYLGSFFTSTINQLTGKNFGSMDIVYCPNINEQNQINDYLEKKCSEIDKTIEDKEKLIEKLVEYKKSLIYECVTGKRKVVA